MQLARPPGAESDPSERSAGEMLLPFLRIVTESALRIPRIDLAPIIRKLCETYWKDAGGGAGSEERLNLRLEPLLLDLDRIRLLSEAVRALLTGGLSPGFSPEHGAVGIHLWSVDQPEPAAILLIADNGEESLGELSTPFITSARQNAEKAGCHLIWQPACGAVWRIHIPANYNRSGAMRCQLKQRC